MSARHIDLNTFKRKDHFDYFRTLAYPYVGVTCEVEITNFYHFLKENHYPIFLTLLWCVSRAANDVPEFRYRIQQDQSIEFDFCDTSHTVAKEDETYAYCVLKADMDLHSFLKIAQSKHEAAKTSGTIDEDPEEALSMIFISTLPWMYFTDLIQPVPIPADSNPRITWGKIQERNGIVTMPVNVLCHHALVDGKHIANFFERLNIRMAEAIASGDIHE